ncbi:MAG: type VI secretion system tube protein TssD [Myxococcales bacterium]|nr:type VI secretion system tube protein Hcp [Myxococcales bacterium]
MSLMTYAYLVGQKSGKVKGGVTQKGRESSIAVIAVSHAVISPRDPASGAPSGKRMHKPWVFTKELDQATPVLYNLLATNETITSAVFKFWAPQVKATTGVGAEVQHFTVTLTNASIASIDFRQANIRHPDLVKLAEYEEVALTYQKIEWTWVQEGISAIDDWMAQSA